MSQTYSNTLTLTVELSPGAGIVYTLIPNADGTQRTNYPNGDYAPALNLPPPTNPTLTNIGTTQMTLGWSYPSSGTDADGFLIQMWQVGTSASWTDIPAPNPTPPVGARTAQQTGLTPDTEYKFRIAATNGLVAGSFIEAWTK
jgi:hypothetical protein